jgi:hypothetical protein
LDKWPEIVLKNKQLRFVTVCGGISILRMAYVGDSNLEVVHPNTPKRLCQIEEIAEAKTLL